MVSAAVMRPDQLQLFFGVEAVRGAGMLPDLQSYYYYIFTLLHLPVLCTYRHLCHNDAHVKLQDQDQDQDHDHEAELGEGAKHSFTQGKARKSRVGTSNTHMGMSLHHSPPSYVLLSS